MSKPAGPIEIRLYADYADWTLWLPPSGGVDVEEARVEEGALIRSLITSELGSDFEVEFET